MRITANQVTSPRLLPMPLVGWLIYGGATHAGHRRRHRDADRPDRHRRRVPGPQARPDGARLAAGSGGRQDLHRRLLRLLRRPRRHPLVDRGRHLLARAAGDRPALEPGARRPAPPQLGRRQAEDLDPDDRLRLPGADPDLGWGPGLPILFGSPIVFALLVLATRPADGDRQARLPDRRDRAAAVPGDSFVGAGIAETLLLVAIVWITWYSAIDYLGQGCRRWRGRRRTGRCTGCGWRPGRCCRSW